LKNTIDLHAHTTASDGVLSPAELVDHAVASGLQLLAVTDHDSTEGVGPALARAAEVALEVWPGVELSTDVDQAEVHMLGYFVDPNASELQETLDRLRESRIGRAEGMVKKLRAMGLLITIERVREIAGEGSVGRPHIAQALFEAGYVPNLKSAFDLYLGRNGPAYVERFKLTAEESIQHIRQAGGMPVLAHPMYITPGGSFDLTTYVGHLREAGLVGIECYYGETGPDVVRGLVKIARELDLIPTGGSDFHSLENSSALGAGGVPAETVERMRAWRQANQ
jgi:predicted metal-dependent phosphoesterase TrpH